VIILTVSDTVTLKYEKTPEYDVYPITRGNGRRETETMADFIETSNTKTAVRELSAPIADVATFAGVIQDVLDTNPFGCVGYMQGGVNYDGVVKNRENYTARINYEDFEAKTVGSISARAPSVAAFTAAAADLLADEDLATAMGGDPVRAFDRESYSCQLKCHDPNGEIYYVTFGRDAVRITSYEDDAIRTTVETWADTVPALA